jgi:hypothetical protein
MNLSLGFAPLKFFQGALDPLDDGSDHIQHETSKASYVETQCQVGTYLVIVCWQRSDGRVFTQEQTDLCSLVEQGGSCVNVTLI